MTYSELTIEFLIDFEQDFELTISRIQTGSGTTTNTWTWVASRSAGFEVTEGTPTATAGERTAINFEAAFDLDFPTGFVTTQTTNSILLASETLGENWLGMSVKNASGVLLSPGTDYNVTFNNFVPTVDTSNIDLALVRSPHYVSTNFNLPTTTKVTIDVTIWSGALDSVPVTPTYTLTRLRPVVSAINLDTNLSEIVRSQLTPSPNIDTTLPSQLVDSDSNSVKWIYYEAVFTDPDNNITPVKGTFSALDGYGYYSENANPGKPTNRILLSNIGNRKIATNGLLMIPFINDGTYASVDVESETLDIDENYVLSTSVQSAKFVQYIIVDPSQTTDRQISVTFTIDVDNKTTIIIDLVDECRYNPKTIVFKNRYGVFETISMFKKETPSMNVKKEEFINQFTTNMSYSVTKHQFRNINFEAMEMVTLNSGYISEDENASYKELLLSDQVWFYVNGELIPVNVESNDITFKNRVNDRLVNYSIDFKYSYNTIQNV